MEALYPEMKPTRWIRSLPILLALAGLMLAWILYGRLKFDHLGQPWALAGLLTLPPLGWLLWRSLRQQRARLQALIEHPLLARMTTAVPGQNQLIQGLLWLGVLGCLCVALARPQGPPVMGQVEGQGIDLLFAIDLSDSSKAADEYPNRLEAAKRGINDVLQQLAGDRVGLMVFSGEAFPVAPFTSDYSALGTLLSEVDHGMLPSATTDIGALLRAAKERFSQNKDDTGRVLVIFSDGENEQGSYQTALKEITDMGVRIFTVGVGTPQGARIPETSPVWGTMGYKTWQGEEVITKLDEGALKNLAQAGQGGYLRLRSIGSLPGQLDALRGRLKTRTSVSNGALTFEERYQAWLWLALLLLGAERLLKQIPPRPRHQPSPFHRILNGLMRAQPRVGTAMVLMVLLSSAWHWPWESYFNGLLGQQDYNQKKYDQAEQNYQKSLEAAPQNPNLLYNQGNSRYRGGKYDSAAEDYRKSLTAPGTTPQEKSQAWYNLGNSLYRQGQKAGKSEADWKKAVEAYQNALKLNPNDRQAQENLDFVQQQLQQRNQQNKPSPQSQSGDKGQGQNNQQGKPQSPPPSGQPSGQPNQPQGNQNQGDEDDKNAFSNDDIQRFLDQREQEEELDRDQFQRFPNAQKTPDPLDPLNSLDDTQKDPNIKDW